MKMQLLQAKIRCLKGINDSGWFKPGRKVTCVFGDNRNIVTQIFRGLEALNPLYDITVVDPFDSYPKTWKQGTYHRPVIKEKKTSVLSVFSAGPELIKGLALLDDSLLETDRIEFGRRLDYSRWISFVELSASARWRDIATAMRTLRTHRLEKEIQSGVPDDNFFKNYKNTDRIKGEIAEVLREWLLYNQPFWSGNIGELCRECLKEVTLNERFRLAGKIVEEALPPVIRLQPTAKLQEDYSFDQLMSPLPEIDPVTALLRLLCQRFSLDSASKEGIDPLRQALSGVSSVSIFRKYAGILTVDENGFYLSGIEYQNGSRAAERIRVLATVTMLTQLLWQHYPLLLLDRYDRDMTGKTLAELADCLNQLGEYTQIIVAADRKENRRVYDFASSLMVTTKGKVE